MDAHVLKTLLQIHLASDSSATLHVPYILATLKPEHLAPSSHLPKWTNRIHSLLHSKEPGGRWAGLSLALISAKLSRNIMIDCAQDWLSVTFTLLSRNETLPVLKATIRLVHAIFSIATDIPEFSRQISTPNVPKFAAVIIPLIEKYTDIELRALCLETFSRLIPLYPTLLRSSSAALNTASLKFLSGQYPSRTPPKVVDAATDLYCCLHLTGGKVGAAAAWRKTFDDTLAFGWSAFHGLRSTFTPGAAQPAEPAAAVALDKDRLHCAVHILCKLLNAHTPRAVQIPFGAMNSFIAALLSAGDADTSVTALDANARTMQLSTNTFIVYRGCELLQKLVVSLPSHVSPHLSHWLTCLACILEDPLPASLRAQALRSVASVLEYHPSFHAPLIVNRLARTTIPQMMVILDREALSESSQPALASTATSKKGRKRARGFEGDESLRLTRNVICATADDADALLGVLEVIRCLLRAAELAPTLRSIASRVLLSIHLALPQMSASALSSDLTLHGKVLRVVQAAVVEVGAGSSSTMGKGLPLAMRGILGGVNQDAFRTFDLLLHPRLPPLVRPLPHVDALALFAGEESMEEKQTRLDMGFARVGDGFSKPVDDIMEDLPVQPVPPTTLQASTTVGFSTTYPVQSQPVRPQAPPSAPPIATMPPPTEPSAAPSLSTGVPMAPTAPASGIPGPSASRLATQPEAINMMVDEDDDEEMPAIDMSSDSEGE